MDRHLIVASTTLEIRPVLKRLGLTSLLDSGPSGCWQRGANGIDVLISGIGQMQASFHLGAVLGKEAYETVLCLGIAGSFRRELTQGSVVCVEQEELADLGAEDHERHLDLFEMGLLDPNKKPFCNGSLRIKVPPLRSIASLAHVRSVTVNRVLGCVESIDRTVKRYDPDIVSMEGAAVFYACIQSAIPCAAIRAISNRVEPRNKSQWNIPGAITALCDKAHEVLDELLE